MISHKYRCIFIRNPKTASTSIVNYFIKHLGGIHETWLLTLPVMRRRGLTQVINLFPSYFTFVFVRNPFDRFLSFWHDKFDPQRPLSGTIRHHSLREYAELAIDLWTHSAFEPDIMDKGMGPHKVPFGELLYDRHHLRHQKVFLLDYNPDYYFNEKRINNAPCSFIGRYENLTEDFRVLLSIIGGPSSYPLPQRNVSFMRWLNNRRQHYSHYYDKTTRRLVERLYACDLDILGYEFEDETSVTVLNPLYDLEEARRKYKERIKLPLGARMSLLLKRIIVGIRVFPVAVVNMFKRFLLKRVVASVPLFTRWHRTYRRILRRP